MHQPKAPVVRRTKVVVIVLRAFLLRTTSLTQCLLANRIVKRSLAAF